MKSNNPLQACSPFFLSIINPGEISFLQISLAGGTGAALIIWVTKKNNISRKKIRENFFISLLDLIFLKNSSRLYFFFPSASSIAFFMYVHNRNITRKYPTDGKTSPNMKVSDFASNCSSSCSFDQAPS